jgi:hypothetical protein
MHYIIGTSFKVSQAGRTLLRDKRFAVGGVYSLIHITPRNGKYVYYFMDLSRNKLDIEFNSCREADSLLAKLKNERIPNYEEQKEDITDTIAD